MSDAILARSAPLESKLPRAANADAFGTAGVLDRLVDLLRGWLAHPIAATALGCSIAAAGFSVGLISPEQTDDSLLAADVSELILPSNDLAGLQ